MDINKHNSGQLSSSSNQSVGNVSSRHKLVIAGSRPEFYDSQSHCSKYLGTIPADELIGERL